MPRIYTSDNSPLDFCKRCFPKTEAIAFAEFGNVGDGPDGRGNCFGYDTEHPPYGDIGYDCHKCGKALTERDYNGSH